MGEKNTGFRSNWAGRWWQTDIKYPRMMSWRWRRDFLWSVSRLLSGMIRLKAKGCTLKALLTTTLIASNESQTCWLKGWLVTMTMVVVVRFSLHCWKKRMKRISIRTKWRSHYQSYRFATRYRAENWTSFFGSTFTKKWWKTNIRLEVMASTEMYI